MNQRKFPPPSDPKGHHVSDNDSLDALLSNFSTFINDNGSDDDGDDDQAVISRDNDYSPVPVTDNENSYV